MQPMPIESEKKAWPMATSSVRAVIFEKSGAKRNRSPSALPGISSERTASTTRTRNSSGISTLADRSIPFCTPQAMMPWVSSTKSTV